MVTEEKMIEIIVIALAVSVLLLYWINFPVKIVHLRVVDGLTYDKAGAPKGFKKLKKNEFVSAEQAMNAIPKSVSNKWWQRPVRYVRVETEDSLIEVPVHPFGAELRKETSLEVLKE